MPFVFHKQDLLIITITRERGTVPTTNDDIGSERIAGAKGYSVGRAAKSSARAVAAHELSGECVKMESY